MAWQWLGWLWAKCASGLCAWPGLGMATADALGRGTRKWGHWRLSSAASRALADGAGDRVQVSWLFFAWGASAGASAAIWTDKAVWGLAIASLSMGWLAAMMWGAKSQKAKALRGSVWLSMVSSSELCQSLGQRPAGYQSIDGACMPLRHLGFMELAKRLGPVGFEGELQREAKARRRLQAMMLACAGSAVAAKWLWRRRSDGRSMALWAKFWGDIGGDRGASKGERWELSASIMAVEMVLMTGSGVKIPNCTADAAELDEESIGVMWGLAPTDASNWRADGILQEEWRESLMACHCGQGRAKWGVARSEACERFTSVWCAALARTDSKWAALLDRSSELLEQKRLSESLPDTGLAKASSRRL